MATIKGFILPLLVLHGLCPAALAQPCGDAASYPTTSAVPWPKAWIERAARIQDLLTTRSFGAIAIGDSIMQGWPPDLLQGAMGQPVLNAGFGAYGTQHMLWRLDTMDWSRQRPRYVLILAGTNDLGFPACAVIRGVLAVVEKAHRVFPGGDIIVTSILPRGDNLMVRNDEIVEINRELGLAAGRSGFRFFNVHDAFLCGHHTPCQLYQPGNLHLTMQGYELMSGRLRQFLGER